MKHIKVSGNSYECGFQVGVKAREEITKAVQLYKKMFRYNKVEWEKAREEANKYIPWIQEYDEDIMEEIRGISEGAEIDLLDIVALNARSEIMSSNDGCTSMAAVPPSTKYRETIIGQNWDWVGKIKDSLIILEIEQDNKPKILMCTEAGIVGKIGMNSSGIGVCLNFLSIQQKEYGVPIHIVLRGILNSEFHSQTIGQISRMPRGTAANYLIASKEGEAIDVEVTCDDYDVIYAENNYITHSNHFCGPKYINIKDTSRLKFPDTHLRNKRAEKLLKQVDGEITVETFKEILSDHINFPDSICRHGEEIKPKLGRPLLANTVFSIIMNLTSGYIEVAPGQPCRNDFKRYEI
ncbi:C45 family autoproteolytic acyltransferase/hydolase [Ammoniphilus sp. 3BR4]|uniref:C45 family autoproteolytic acyltransferase/hydolase n=1 Tax=Ammoniphilus sp. 3BR4 TaxID=3158265 RepID=UPI0034668FC4